MAVILCMKWGRAYSADYVNILYRAVSANLSPPFRFVCLTDDPANLDSDIETLPLPNMHLSPARMQAGGWQKLCVFAPELYDIKGRVLFLDIDVIITGKLDVFFEIDAPLVMIREWPQLGHRLTFRRAFGGNSSVFAFDIGGQAQIYEHFLADRDRAFAEFRNEQRFLSAHARGLSYWPKGLCLSFKSDLMRAPPLNFLMPPRTLPPAARIVLFHGRPLPEEVVRDGWWGKGLRRGHGALDWAKKHWQAYQ